VEYNPLARGPQAGRKNRMAGTGIGKQILCFFKKKIIFLLQIIVVFF
jgi:hypothetical protein